MSFCLQPIILKICKIKGALKFKLLLRFLCFLTTHPMVDIILRNLCFVVNYVPIDDEDEEYVLI